MSETITERLPIRETMKEVVKPEPLFPLIPKIRVWELNEVFHGPWNSLQGEQFYVVSDCEPVFKAIELRDQHIARFDEGIQTILSRIPSDYQVVVRTDSVFADLLASLTASVAKMGEALHKK